MAYSHETRNSNMQKLLQVNHRFMNIYEVSRKSKYKCNGIGRILSPSLARTIVITATICLFFTTQHQQTVFTTLLREDEKSLAHDRLQAIYSK